MGGVEEQTQQKGRGSNIEKMGAEIKNSVIQTFLAQVFSFLSFSFLLLLFLLLLIYSNCNFQGTAIGLTALLSVSVIHAPAIPVVAAAGFGFIPYKFVIIVSVVVVVFVVIVVVAMTECSLPYFLFPPDVALFAKLLLKTSKKTKKRLMKKSLAK